MQRENNLHPPLGWQKQTNIVFQVMRVYYENRIAKLFFLLLLMQNMCF